MNEILLNVLSIIVTAVIIPVISFLGYKLSSFLTTKIKDEKAAAFFKQASEIVLNAVRSVFQTYVESLKNSGQFNKDAQAIAFNQAKAIIVNQMSQELKSFIIANYGDLNEWIKNQIEASINQLKN